MKSNSCILPYTMSSAVFQEHYFKKSSLEITATHGFMVPVTPLPGLQHLTRSFNHSVNSLKQAGSHFGQLYLQVGMPRNMVLWGVPNGLKIMRNISRNMLWRI